MQIDFHAHILPGCDHGCKRRRVAKKQLQMADEAGVDVICATSHFYPDRERLEDFVVRRQQSAERLQTVFEESEFSHPRILIGTEILLCEGLHMLDGLEALCLEGTNILLLELPYSGVTDELIDTIEALGAGGKYQIIFAHVDRYDKKVIENLLGMGIPAQINVDSLCKLFIPRSIKRWIKHGAVVAFGSDIHGDDKGYKNWNKARKRFGKHWDDIMSRTEKFIEDCKIG